MKIRLTESQYIDFLNEKKLRFLRKNGCNTCNKKSGLLAEMYLQEDLKVGKGVVCLNQNDVAEYINSVRLGAVKIADKYKQFLDIINFNKLQGKTFTTANPFIHGKSKLFFDDEGGVQTENKRITQLKKELDELYTEYRKAITSKSGSADNIANKIKKRLGNLLDIYEGLEVDIENFRKNLLVEPRTIISKNEKMMKSGGKNDVVVNTGIPAVGAIVFNTAANEFQMVETCPGRGTCVNFCYALTSNYTRFMGTYDVMIRRLNLMINNPKKYEDKLFNELYNLAKNKNAFLYKAELNDVVRNFISKGKKQLNNLKNQNPELSFDEIFDFKKIGLGKEFEEYMTAYLIEKKRVVLRWNDSGDFFNETYQVLASNVLKRLRDLDVYIVSTTYTKIADVSADVKKLFSKEMDFAIYSIGGASKVETKKFNAATETNRPIKKAISPQGDIFINPITKEPYDYLFSDLNYILDIRKQKEPNNKIYTAIAKTYFKTEYNPKDHIQSSKIKNEIESLIPSVREEFKEQMKEYLKREYNESVSFFDIVFLDELKNNPKKQYGEKRYYVIVPKGSGDDATIYSTTKWILNLLH